MKALQPAQFAPSPALHPGLQRLIERGVLSRAVRDETPEEVAAFGARVDDAVSRGEVTPAQAAALRQMLGLRPVPPRVHRVSRRRLQ